MSIIDSILGFAGARSGLAGPLTELNRRLTNHFATSTKARPRAYSLWSPVPGPGVDEFGSPKLPDTTVSDYITDYTSWPALTDRNFSGRHLPPAKPETLANLPPLGSDPFSNPAAVTGPTALFARQGAMKESRSSLLFTFFAQWFTDSILRINPIDRRQNTSNHDIDLCQIYGLSESTTRVLRSGSGGRLKNQMLKIAGGAEEEFPQHLCEEVDGAFEVKAAFAGLPAVNRNVAAILGPLANQKPPRERNFYATGLERGNSSIGYAAISTVFLREHNRIAAELQKREPSWNDERLFQTARNINIVILMKLVVEDYINHIVGHKVFKLDHQFAEEQHWYRANWIALEFDLLYRWHGLPPDAIALPDGTKLSPNEFRNNNALLERMGVGALIDVASHQRAGKIGLKNTPSYLLGAEYQSLKMGRDFRVKPYNEYRELFSLPRLTSFAGLTRDAELRGSLEQMYGDIDQVEFVVGLFAEQAHDGFLFGDLLNSMVAYDAFTQIYSNPLLSKNVYTSDTFTHFGLELIEETTSIQVLIDRNIDAPARASLEAIV